MASEWYCRVGGQEYGPMTGGKLKQLAAKGKLQPKNQIRKGADGEWLPASSVKGLFPDPAEQADGAADEESTDASAAKPAQSPTDQPVVQKLPDDVEFTYGKQVKHGLIALPCILLPAIGFQALVWLGKSDPEGKLSVSICFLVFFGLLAIIPILMILQGRRTVAISNGRLKFTSLFGGFEFALGDVQELAWRIKNFGGATFVTGETNSTLPLYGLHVTDAKSLISILRGAFDPAKQSGWPAFLYAVCYGQLGTSDERKAVASAVNSTATKIVAVLAPVLLIAKRSVLRHILPEAVVWIILLVGLALFVVLFGYLRIRRHARIKKLADEFVISHGHALPFGAV